MRDKKVLIVDDDADFVRLTSLLFKREGAQIIIAPDGLEGIGKFISTSPDLILLDLMLPGMNGLELCEKVQEVSDTPIIMITAFYDEKVMLRGLEAGADDFLSKLLNPQILLARAKAVLRRAERVKIQADSLTYQNGYLSMDVAKRDVLILGNRVKLTPVEFRLLLYLVHHAGQVLTYHRILAHIWGDEYRQCTEYVHVYISHLRRKIEEDPKHPRNILTVHGVGYVFEMDEMTSSS
ncbi:MAG TPA: response regulator transcription factor [Anaerolineales bacterium]|nr:response regulator transcription factor [Anaerolineales bacterium]